MTTLSWFRFRASGRTFILVTAALLVGLVSLLALKSLVAEDYNGDGYDDYTGEWVGYDDGTGSYDDGTGYYDDGTGYYGDDSGDSDLDGLTDGEEVAIGTDSTQADSDGDGLGDYEEVYGVEITYEYEVYSHTESSYDEATGEYSEWDVYETAYHYEVVLTDPLDPDTDGDFLPDGHEVNLSLNPLDPADGTADVDGDGLTAGEEYLLGTDPLLPDTDGDQWDDEIEVFEATDPTDPASFPTEEGEGETTTEGAGPGEEGDPNGDGGADNPGMGAGDSGAGGGGGGSASSSDTGEGGDSATGGGSSSGDTVPDGTPPDETVVPGSETNETVGNVYLVGRVATFQPGGGKTVKCSKWIPSSTSSKPTTVAMNPPGWPIIPAMCPESTEARFRPQRW